MCNCKESVYCGSFEHSLYKNTLNREKTNKQQTKITLSPSFTRENRIYVIV